MGGPAKGRADFLVLGDWNATCYECGRKRKASYLRKHWQGYYVCPEHWEPRHPQDFVRAIPDNMVVPWAQDQSDAFVNIGCTLQTISAIPGWAIPGCVIPGKTFPSLPPGAAFISELSAIASIAVSGVSITGVVIE